MYLQIASWRAVSGEKCLQGARMLELPFRNGLHFEAQPESAQSICDALNRLRLDPLELFFAQLKLRINTDYGGRKIY